jgi:hypothetical protein
MNPAAPVTSTFIALTLESSTNNVQPDESHSTVPRSARATDVPLQVGLLLLGHRAFG